MRYTDYRHSVPSYIQTLSDKLERDHCANTMAARHEHNHFWQPYVRLNLNNWCERRQVVIEELRYLARVPCIKNDFTFRKYVSNVTSTIVHNTVFVLIIYKMENRRMKITYQSLVGIL